MQTNFHLDLETADPDDIFTLALLATHPKSNLVGVTIHPGGLDRVSVVKHVMKLLGVSVPVGVGTPKSDGNRVSEFHYNWLGKIEQVKADGTAVEVISEVCHQHPADVHLVTGAALTNIAKAYEARCNNAFFTHWTCQGGFAGKNIVEEEFMLEKFRGRTTCPTYNLNGDPKAALMLFDTSGTPPIMIRRMVPKSICHGVFWTPEFQERVPFGKHAGLDLIKDGMRHYFKRKPEGKALHDVIAAVAALNSGTIGGWTLVSPYREKGEWGCHPATGATAVEILTSFNQDGFEAGLVE